MKRLRAFLSPAEVASLREASLGSAEARGGANAPRRRVDGDWQAGRQGTGYDKLPLPREGPLVARALAELGTPFGDYWDVYLIRYRDGAHVRDHVDPAEHGRRHRRLNAMLALPRAGGELWIDGVLVELAVGDAVVFEPDREVHRVTPVDGTRLVYSVGAWV